jgi:MraZ protein
VGGSSSVTLHGQFDITLDDKSRIILPAVFRRKMNTDILFITEGKDNNLWVYPPTKFDKLIEDLEELTDPFSQDDRDLVRDMIGSCHEADIDKSGRVLIAESLRDFAGLTKDCVVVGMINYLEIWDKEKFLISKTKSKENTKATEDMSRRIKHKKGVVV